MKNWTMDNVKKINKCINTDSLTIRYTPLSFGKLRGIVKMFPHFLFYNSILLMITKTKYIIFLHDHPAFQHIFPSFLPTV
jgi:hypothetical protein